MRLRHVFLLVLDRRRSGHFDSARFSSRAEPRDGRGCSATRVHDVHAGERPESHLLAGQAAAHGGGQSLVSRRPRQRDPGAHRLRASLRAHDVSGLEARRGRHALQAARGRGRFRHQRHHELRSDQLLRDRAVESAGAGALDRIRSHGLPAGRARREGARQPARRRAQRAQAEPRKPAVWCSRGVALSVALSGRAPVPRRGDRLARRSRGRPARRRAAVLPSVLHAEQCQPRHRRRLRARRRAQARREILRPPEEGPRRSANHRDDAADHRGEAPHGHRHRQAAARLHRVAHAGDL